MTEPSSPPAEPEPQVIQRDLTAEVYFTLQPSRQPQNLIDGLLYVSPMPSEEHEDAVLAVAEATHAFALANGGKVFVGPDCWLAGATVIQPDVAYLSPERVRLAGRFIRGAPDLAVEVVSPGTHAFDTQAKFEAYGHAGVREAWFVDPRQRTVTVVSSDGSKWLSETVVAFAEPIPSAVLPGIGAAGLA